MKHRIPAPLLIGCLASLAVAVPICAQGQESPADFSDSDLPAHEWRARLEESRKKSQEFISRAHSKTSDDFDAAKERARLADERVMNDDSLRTGDVVSTSKGLLVFKGSLDRERQPSDFVPIESMPR